MKKTVEYAQYNYYIDTLEISGNQIQGSNSTSKKTDSPIKQIKMESVDKEPNEKRKFIKKDYPKIIKKIQQQSKNTL